MILVDQAIWPWRGMRWAHLVSDESYDELHAFAARLGILPPDDGNAPVDIVTGDVLDELDDVLPVRGTSTTCGEEQPASARAGPTTSRRASPRDRVSPRPAIAP